MTYRAAIDWLFSIQMFGIKLGLEGAHHLLAEFGAFPDAGRTVIHVAGTNGKGSTCAMIDSIARACGRRTGLFTSPHLVDFRERIRVSGVEIPEEATASMLTRLRVICESMEHHPTFFEVALALALRWFRERGCELIILETGMGGRLDATTAVPADVCVITPVGMDHMQWLGDTLAEIAKEKAGIMVAGKPVVSAPQEPAARAVLECEANVCRAPLEFVNEPLLGYRIALAGVHQQWNAALAVTALHRAGVPMNADQVRHGLATVSWPGRFEEIMPGVVLDGAHNPHAVKVLIDTWKQVFGTVRPAMVFGAVAAKDVPGMLAMLAPLTSKIFLCRVDSPRGLPVDDLVAALPPDAPPYEAFEDFSSAYQTAIAEGMPVLVTGSLFLVGEARAMLSKQDFRPSSQ